MEQTFYGTFGMSNENKNCFVVIRAENRMKAREQMFDMYDNKWAFLYSETEWVLPDGRTQQETYNLQEI